MLRMLLATGGTLVALAPGLGAEPVRRGPAPAPLVWTTSPAIAAVPPEGLLEKARAIAGPSAVLGTPSLTQLTDEGWLRTVVEVRAWRITATDVVVTMARFPRALVPVDESRRVTVTVDMAFDDSGPLQHEAHGGLLDGRGTGGLRPPTHGVRQRPGPALIPVARAGARRPALRNAGGGSTRRWIGSREGPPRPGSDRAVRRPCAARPALRGSGRRRPGRRA